MRTTIWINIGKKHEVDFTRNEIFLVLRAVVGNWTRKKNAQKYHQPQSSKNWKASFLRSWAAGLTFEKSFTWCALEKSSVEHGTLQEDPVDTKHSDDAFLLCLSWSQQEEVFLPGAVLQQKGTAICSVQVLCHHDPHARNDLWRSEKVRV